MAAKLNTRTADQTRSHIKVSLLVKRLQDYALRETDNNGDLKVAEMTPNHIAAARVLLDKALPNLSATELSGGLDSGTKADSTDADLQAIIDASKGKVESITNK